MLWTQDAGVVLEGTIRQISVPAVSAGQGNLEISLTGVGCRRGVGECVVLYVCKSRKGRK
jgi:hypothetical protein